MAKVVRLTDVGVFCKNLEEAKDFYTNRLGLVVRGSMPEHGYLQLGATKDGEDAGMDLWQPVPEWGEEMYRRGVEQIGEVTGIGFRTANLAKTVERLKDRGVQVEQEGDAFARVTDPDGNVLFLEQPREAEGDEAGLASLAWITVVVRDKDKARAFFETLGLQAETIPREDEEEGPDFTVYRLGPEGTAVLPFTPTKEMYDDPADYEADLAHIGEVTSIGFQVEDVHGMEAKLKAEGVAIREGLTKQPWGGTTVKVLDPDGNEYLLYEMAA